MTRFEELERLVLDVMGINNPFLEDEHDAYSYSESTLEDTILYSEAHGLDIHEYTQDQEMIDLFNEVIKLRDIKFK